MNGDVQSRLEAVLGRIQAACSRAKRDVSGVRIVTVTKTFGPAAVEEAAGCGLTVMGESRIQEAKQKIPLCPGNLEWHMIGHLQRNKVKDAVSMFRMIHSVDSLRLLETINSVSAAAGVSMPVCLEINVSGEASKFGMKPDEVLAVLESSSRLMNIDIAGLMTVPPFTQDPQEARPFFAALRDLRDKCREKTGVPLDELSMGMSNDFEIAVEEGATLVRLGSVLFGERKKKEPLNGTGDGVMMEE